MIRGEYVNILAKKIDLQLNEKDYKNLINFFYDKKKFDKFSVSIEIENHPSIISFFENSSYLDILTICITDITDITSNKSYYLRASNIYEVKHIYLNFSEEYLLNRYILNIKNIKIPELFDITNCCTNDEDMNISEYLLTIVNFCDESELKKFCLALYNKDCINSSTLSKSNMDIILSKLSYYGYEQISDDIKYYQQKFSKKTFLKNKLEIEDLCSFIIYCLGYFYQFNDIKYIRALIPEIIE